MELGPKTLRPSNPVEKVVTTSHGKLLGLLVRTEAEAALGEAQQASGRTRDS